MGKLLIVLSSFYSLSCEFKAVYLCEFSSLKEDTTFFFIFWYRRVERLLTVCKMLEATGAVVNITYLYLDVNYMCYLIGMSFLSISPFFSRII